MRPFSMPKIRNSKHNRYFDILGKSTPWVMGQSVVMAHGIRAKAVGFSYYGPRNIGDFVAEAIAQYCCLENPGSITMDVINTLLKG